MIASNGLLTLSALVMFLPISKSSSPHELTDLVHVSKVRVLEVRDILDPFRLRWHTGVSISLLIPPDQQHAQHNSNHNLATDATNDQFASSLVNRCFPPKEPVWANDVSNTIGEKHEGGGCCSLCVAGHVRCRHLQGNNERTDE